MKIKLTTNQKTAYEKIIEEATTDCYEEYEQAAGWACILEDNIFMPCKCFIGKEEAILNKIEQHENSVLGLITIDKIKIRTPIEDIKSKDKNMTIYIDAYIYWRKNG